MPPCQQSTQDRSLALATKLVEPHPPSAPLPDMPFLPKLECTAAHLHHTNTPISLTLSLTVQNCGRGSQTSYTISLIPFLSHCLSLTSTSTSNMSTMCATTPTLAHALSCSLPSSISPSLPTHSLSLSMSLSLSVSHSQSHCRLLTSTSSSNLSTYLTVQPMLTTSLTVAGVTRWPSTESLHTTNKHCWSTQTPTPRQQISRPLSTQCAHMVKVRRHLIFTCP